MPNLKATFVQYSFKTRLLWV